MQAQGRFVRQYGAQRRAFGAAFEEKRHPIRKTCCAPGLEANGCIVSCQLPDVFRWKERRLAPEAYVQGARPSAQVHPVLQCPQGRTSYSPALYCQPTNVWIALTTSSTHSWCSITTMHLSAVGLAVGGEGLWCAAARVVLQGCSSTLPQSGKSPGRGEQHARLCSDCTTFTTTLFCAALSVRCRHGHAPRAPPIAASLPQPRTPWAVGYTGSPHARFVPFSFTDLSDPIMKTEKVALSPGRYGSSATVPLPTWILSSPLAP